MTWSATIRSNSCDGATHRDAQNRTDSPGPAHSLARFASKDLPNRQPDVEGPEERNVRGCRRPSCAGTWAARYDGFEDPTGARLTNVRVTAGKLAEGSDARRERREGGVDDLGEGNPGKSLPEEAAQLFAVLSGGRSRRQGIRRSRRQSLSRCREWGWPVARSSRSLCPKTIKPLHLLFFSRRNSSEQNNSSCC